MSDKLGPWQLGTKGGEPFLGKDGAVEPTYSEEIAAAIDAEVRRMLDIAHDEARELLTLHRVTLDRLAEALVEHETLGDEQLNVIFEAGDARPPKSSAKAMAKAAGTSAPAGTAASVGPSLALGSSPADTSPATPSGDEYQSERHSE
jgi:cell division protease FtsH